MFYFKLIDFTSSVKNFKSQKSVLLLFLYVCLYTKSYYVCMAQYDLYVKMYVFQGYVFFVSLPLLHFLTLHIKI